MSRPKKPPLPALTPAQRALFDSERDVPELAARAAVRAMGQARFRHLEWDEILAIASISAMEAAVTFDPARGSPYRIWAFFLAINEVMLAARQERERHAKARAMIRASALLYFAEASAGVEIGADTEESITAKLHAFTNPVVGLAMMEVAAAKPTGGGEDEIAERDAAARAGEALRGVLAALAPEERRMIDLHFVERMSLTEMATVMGVEKPQYRTFVRRFHDLLASIREGLARRGITETPPWIEGISGHALGPEQ